MSRSRSGRDCAVPQYKNNSRFGDATEEMVNAGGTGGTPTCDATSGAVPRGVAVKPQHAPSSPATVVQVKVVRRVVCHTPSASSGSIGIAHTTSPQHAKLDKTVLPYNAMDHQDLQTLAHGPTPSPTTPWPASVGIVPWPTSTEWPAVALDAMVVCPKRPVPAVGGTWCMHPVTGCYVLFEASPGRG